MGGLKRAMRKELSCQHREFRQQLQRAAQVHEVGLAGVVEQAPEGVLGQIELADVDGVFGDRIELRGVATKPTPVRQRMGNVLDQGFL